MWSKLKPNTGQMSPWKNVAKEIFASNKGPKKKEESFYIGGKKKPNRGCNLNVFFRPYSSKFSESQTFGNKKS